MLVTVMNYSSCKVTIVGVKVNAAFRAYQERQHLLGSVVEMHAEWPRL